jgi:hypothetical protein
MVIRSVLAYAAPNWHEIGGEPEEIKQNPYFNTKQMPTNYKRRIQGYSGALFGIGNSDIIIGLIFR